jgi:heme exporter protein D
MDLGPHAAFILAAYGAAFVILAALIIWIALDYRFQRRLLAELDRSGVTRRSDRRARDAAPSTVESA